MNINKEEAWKSIVDYEGFYEISNYGNVRSVDRVLNNRIYYGKNLKPHINRSGYSMIHLTKNCKSKFKAVHRLVATHFVLNPFNFEFVNHLDCNKQNNTIENLEWTTHIENIRHAIKNGRMNHLFGENNSKSVHSKEIVDKIRQEYNSSFTTMSILAKKYYCSKESIRSIISNDNWYDEKYSPKEILHAKGSKNSQSKLDESNVLKIRYLYEQGNSYRYLSSLFKVSIHTIKAIIKRKRWSHI